jgi:hypothetical protein
LRDLRVGGRCIFQVSRAEAAELSSLLTTLGVCMLKIQRSANGRIFFTLSGRIEAEDVKELREQLAFETGGATAGFGFEGRDTRQPGRGGISRRLLGRQHQARELPRLYPRGRRTR